MRARIFAALGNSERLATALFVLAALGAAIFLLVLQAPLTFRADDWDFLVNRPQNGLDGLLEPHFGHLLAIEALVYRGLAEIFGLGSAIPYQFVATALFATAMLLVFRWLALRVGTWLALAVLLPVLFMGSASEDLLWSFQLAYFGSVACGVGAFLILDQGRPNGDRIATALLTASVLFSSLGICFLVAVTTRILLEPERWRRVAVVALPALLYIGWWLGWGHEADSRITDSNLVHAPDYVIKGLAASLASLFGLVDTTSLIAVPPYAGEARSGPEVGGYVLLAIFAVAAVVAIRVRRLSASRVLPLAALLLSFWVSVAATAQFFFSAPIASRYQWIGAIFILMLAAEARPGRSSALVGDRGRPRPRCVRDPGQRQAAARGRGSLRSCEPDRARRSGGARDRLGCRRSIARGLVADPVAVSVQRRGLSGKRRRVRVAGVHGERAQRGARGCPSRRRRRARGALHAPGRARARGHCERGRRSLPGPSQRRADADRDRRRAWRGRHPIALARAG